MQKLKTKLWIVICVLTSFCTAELYAVDATLQWKTIHTAHFKIHFPHGYEAQADEVASIAEKAHQKLYPIINWTPQDKTHLVVSDETDFANGMATPLHFNRSVIFLAPPDEARGIEDYTNWLETLIVHEYVHVLHLDKVRGGVKGLRDIFGRQFLLFPNAYQPAWMIEGLATYYETDIEKQSGRGQSALFSAMMQAEIDRGIKPVSKVNLTLRSWPMGSTPYLYGVYFYQFLADTYGQKAIHALIEGYSNNILPFSINSNAKLVLGKDISDLWDEFSVYLSERYTAGADLGGQGVQLTHSGYQTQNFVLGKNGEAYYVDNNPYEHAALKRITAEGQVEYLVDVHSSARIDIHEERGVLISHAEFCDEYNINYDLYIYNNQQLERLTECGRYRWSSWNKQGDTIYAVKLVKGNSWLVELDRNGHEKAVLWKAQQGEVIAQLDYSAEKNALVAARFTKEHGWDIAEFIIDVGEWRFITFDSAIDMYPAYVEGGSIVFSSDRTGRYQVYRYMHEENMLEQITQVPYAAFKPRQKDLQSPIYFSGYHGSGSDLYKLDQPEVIQTAAFVKSEKPDVTNLSEDDEVHAEIKDYAAFDSMYPRWWLPDIRLTDERDEFGIVTSAHDALALHRYQLSLRYDTENDWFAGGISYGYANRLFMGYERSVDIFLDDNNQFTVARAVDDWFAVLQFSDPGVEASLHYLAGIVMSEASDVKRADNVLALRDTKDNLFGLALLYRSTHRYIRSISESDGRAIRLVAETSEVMDSDFSGEIYTLDWREFISLGEQHVLALRLVQGWGTEQPERFRLGGEDNDYDLLDLITPVGDAVFSKREYALRGYPEGLVELRGRRMQLASLEWRIPGGLIERGLMAPPIGISQWSATLFAESGAAYTDRRADKYYSSVGVELEADINLFYGLNSRMRLGLAHGLDNELGENRAYFMLGVSF